MAKLSIFLPPFAGDYSGAAGVLFGLNGVNVIVDASCCTHNYTSYDEPRWKSHRRATFGAQLRTLEATLGDDMRLLDQTEDAVHKLSAPCVALIGTPVPALVGMDLDGMARELQQRCSIPAFGLSTTGFDTYELGASMAQTLLAERFAQSRKSTHAENPNHLVNVLGVTVHDFGSNAVMHAVETAVLAQAYDLLSQRAITPCQEIDVAWSTAGDYSLDDIISAGTADESIVVSWSGLAAARLLKQHFGVPYRIGLPEEALRALPGAASLLDEVAELIADPSTAPFSLPVSLLIVHDQVIANSLRAILRTCSIDATIYVASLFSMDSDLKEPGDFCIATERDLITFASENPNIIIAGDPLLRRLPNVGDALRWDLPHEAVSCTLYL